MPSVGIDDADLLVEIRPAGMQRHADRPARAEDLLQVADLQVGRAVGVAGPTRASTGETMVTVCPCGPAFHSTPPLIHAPRMAIMPGLITRLRWNISWSCGLVEHRVQPAAQLRQAGHLEVLVFQEQGLVGAVDLGAREVVLHDVGIDDRALDGGRELGRALQRPELRIDVVLPRIGGDHDRPLPGPHLGAAGAGNRMESPRKRAMSNTILAGLCIFSPRAG